MASTSTIVPLSAVTAASHRTFEQGLEENFSEDKFQRVPSSHHLKRTKESLKLHIAELLHLLLCL
jgi:hypothetical protein